MAVNSVVIFTLSAIIGVIVLIFIARVYFETRIREFFVFFWFWFFVVFLSICIPLRETFVTSLLYYKTLECGYIGFGSSLYFHSILVLENEKSKMRKVFLRTFGTVYTTILVIAVVFWRSMEQEYAFHILWNEEPHPRYAGYGAGITIGSNVLYSSGHVLPRQLFTFISCLLFFYAYWSIKPVFISDRVKYAHRIWKLVSIFLVMFALSQNLWRIIPLNPEYGISLATLSGALTLIIIFRYPEGFLLSKSQAIRVIGLYNITAKEHINKKPDTSLKSDLVTYLLEVSERV